MTSDAQAQVQHEETPADADQSIMVSSDVTLDLEDDPNTSQSDVIFVQEVR